MMIKKNTHINRSILKRTLLVIGVFLWTIFIIGCQKDKVASVTLDVSMDSTNYKLGDSIIYHFNGYADYINYFSGEKVANYPTLLGYRYEFHNRSLANGKAILQFQSVMQNSGQLNTLSLLASRNFNGKFDTASIMAATWIDITNRCVLSDGISTTSFSSGSIDISDFKDSAVFFAFRYKAVTGLVQPRWTINNLNLTFYAIGADSTNSITNDTFTVATLNPVWKAINLSTNTQKWSVSTSQLLFTGASSTAASNEAWVISPVLYLNRVPADIPKSLVKTYTDAMMTSFKPPPYSGSGKYKVAFVASNASFAGQNKTVKELQVEISP
jgi:Domain of unknown function (DUF5017)